MRGPRVGCCFEGSLRVLNLDPPVLTVTGFLPPEQCDALIHAAQASGRMTQSAVGGHNVDKKKEIRTSSTLAASAEVRHPPSACAAAMLAPLSSRFDF